MTGATLTIAAYEASGGVLGALGRRAEEIYTGLEESERDMARQIFLRLVTLGEGIEDTRRRVLRSEIEALARLPNHHTSTSAGDGRSSVVSAVMDCFGRYRLLTFDHDPATRTPTVEVAHEALLREWPRLRNWLDESRDEVRMQRMLGAATQEWLAAKRDPGFLLRGTRLDQFALWVDETDIVLTKDERAYLAASLAERKERQAAEVERQAHETQLKQRSRRFLQALVGVFAMAAVVAILLSGVAFNQRGIAQENAATATYAQGEALVLAELAGYPAVNRRK